MTDPLKIGDKQQATMLHLKLTGLLREPLIQFLLFGIVIFAVDDYLVASRDDPRRIVIDDNKLTQLIDIFIEGQGREPTAKEIDNLIIKWTQNEILFREAKQLGLDRGDEMIRSRLILKMRNVLFNNVVVDAPHDEELQTFFEFNRAAYDRPERFDFEQLLLPAAKSLDEARRVAQRLTKKPLPEQYSRELRRYKERPVDNLSVLFGKADEQALTQAAIGEWVVVTTDRGLHIARITKRYPPQKVQLADVKSAVVRDWTKFKNDMQLANQTKTIADRYRVEFDFSPKIRGELERAALPVGTAAPPLVQQSDRRSQQTPFTN